MIRKAKRLWSNYKWFIKESQHYMQGHNLKKVFILLLFKGIGFARMMEQDWQSKNNEKLDVFGRV